MEFETKQEHERRKWAELPKTCKICLQTMPRSKFPRKYGKHRGYRSACSRCYEKVKRVKRFGPPRKKLEPQVKMARKVARLLWRRTGITREQAQAIAQSQGGRCPICGRLAEEATPTKPNLCLDHCHETESFRGMICHNCNIMLGMSRDNPDVLRNAAEYLERFATTDDGEPYGRAV